LAKQQQQQLQQQQQDDDRSTSSSFTHTRATTHVLFLLLHQKVA